MAESSKGGGLTGEDAGDWLRRFGAFSKTEPLLHVERVITITRETLQAGFIWDILEPVQIKMLTPRTGADAEAVLATFSVGQRRLYGVHMYLSEVHHGGHEYYYRYSGALTRPDALAGLEMIGAKAAHEILVESMKRFPEPPSVEFDARQEALNKLPNRVFDDLDGRLYAVENQVDELMQAYVLAHPEEFLWSGTVTEVKHPHKLEVVDGELEWMPQRS